MWVGNFHPISCVDIITWITTDVVHDSDSICDQTVRWNNYWEARDAENYSMNKILRNPHQLRRRNLLFCIIKSVNGFSTKSCVEDGSATVANISLIGESSDVTHTGLKLPPIWGVSRKAISLCDGNGPVILAISYFFVCNQLPRYVDEKPRLRSALTRSFMHPIKSIHIGVNFIAFYFRQKKKAVPESWEAVESLVIWRAHISKLEQTLRIVLNHMVDGTWAGCTFRGTCCVCYPILPTVQLELRPYQ